jgi:transcriptional regulator with XRE-family HTH domain
VNSDWLTLVVMDLAQKLAANLRARRGNKTQDEFARKLGISRATLSRLESAAQNTTISTLEQISKSLRCDVGELFVVSPKG